MSRLKLLWSFFVVMLTVLLLTGCGGEAVTILPALTEDTESTSAVAAETLRLNQSDITLSVGESTLLVAIVSPLDAYDRRVTFTCDDPTVCSVTEDGHITALSKGNTTVSAQAADGALTALCSVTVKGSEHVEEGDYIRVSGITISKTGSYLAVGDTLSLSAAVQPADAFYQGITWVNSNTRAVTMETDGEIRAIAPGRSVITVISEDGEYSATCEIQVYARLEGILLSSRYLSVKPGTKTALTTTLNPANAAHYNGYTWSSSDPSVVSVDAKGNLSAKKYGSAVITVTANGTKVSASCTVKVEDSVSYIPLDSFTLQHTEATLSAGESFTLLSKRVPENSNEVLTYTSSDTAVATVTKDGVVTAVAPGSATVTVSSSDGVLSQTFALTVVKASVGARIYLSVDSHTLTVGNTFKLTYGYSQKPAAGDTVRFTVSDSAVLSVDASGTVKALSEGSATVYATMTESGYTACCTVTVRAVMPETLFLSEERLTLALGSCYTLNATVLPAGASGTALTYESSAPEIVSVDASGVLTVHHAGTAKITVQTTVGGLRAVCVVRAADERLTAMEFTESTLSLTIGQSHALTLRATPSDAETGGVTFHSSAPTVLSVDEKGNITALAAGTATVYAVNPLGGATATCLVTVSNDATIKTEVSGS